uniref:Thioredoxin domain-containing protein 17 n=1 Tax=Schistosoma japonicum TaxID=6182 RepID=Q5DAS7_SCHJA|nr:SJCHGC01827 protein [Schistosoma japonicum]
MPIEQLFIQSIDELTSQIEKARQNGRHVFVYFSGSTDMNTGDSWSEDCCKCESILESTIGVTKDSDLFLMIEVGDENEWKDPNNKFRIHPVYQIKELPTLLSLSSLNGEAHVVINRLEGKSCLDSTNVQTLFKAN